MIDIPLFKSLRIEINSDCNRKCVFCPRGTDTTRWVGGGQDGKKQKLIDKKMSKEDVLSIIDQCVALGFSGQVGFDFYNEAAMDDRLIEFCEYAKFTKGLKVNLVTNGDRMKKDEDFAKEVLRVADRVTVSIYDYKDNQGRIKLMQWWKNRMQELGSSRGQVKIAGDYFNFSTRGGLVKRHEKFMHKSHLDEELPLKADCNKIHKKLNIRYDGDVPICCEDSHVRFSLGNVLETSVKEVWYGDRMQTATEILSRGDRASIIPCSKCVKGAGYGSGRAIPSKVPARKTPKEKL